MQRERAFDSRVARRSMGALINYLGLVCASGALIGWCNGRSCAGRELYLAPTQAHESARREASLASRLTSRLAINEPAG